MKFIYLFILTLVYGYCVGAGKKNVLFLVADDMRPELGSYYGHDFPSTVHPKMHSPNIDALASKSLLLKRAHVQQALCSPSRTSLLTGRRPDTIHVYDLRSYFRKVGGNFTTLPEYFKLNGYVSAGIGKIFHPGPASGYDDPISWSLPYFHAKTYGWETLEHSWLAVPDNETINKPLVDAQIADRAIETLKALAPDAKSGAKPFFLAVGFHKPHLPFVFPESMLQFYPEDEIHLPPDPYCPKDMPEVAWFTPGGMIRYQDIGSLNYTGQINEQLPERKVRELRRAYYSAVSWTDLLVGRVIQELDTLGLANDTIISFFGDHGWQLGEHAEWCKQTNFELATHAPMMVHVPGLTEKGIVAEQLTEFVDLFPTLVEAAGLCQLPLCAENSSAVALCREGESLFPLIRNSSTPWKQAAFSQYPRNHNGTNVMGYTMRTDQYRYTEWVEFSGPPNYKPDWSKRYGIELYDHKVDPYEDVNKANDASYANMRQNLSKQLHAGWRDARVTGNNKPSTSIFNGKENLIG